MLDVRLIMNLEDGSVLPEADVPADDAAARARLGDFAGMEGALVIAGDDGMRLVFADTLRLLVPAFCLDGMAALLRDKRKVVEFFNHEETVVLSVERDEVQLAGRHVVPTRTLPLAEYAAAMKACGERYLALARRMWRDDPAGAWPLEELEASLALSG